MATERRQPTETEVTPLLMRQNAIKTRHQRSVYEGIHKQSWEKRQPHGDRPLLMQQSHQHSVYEVRVDVSWSRENGKRRRRQGTINTSTSFSCVCSLIRCSAVTTATQFCAWGSEEQDGRRSTLSFIARRQKQHQRQHQYQRQTKLPVIPAVINSP